MTGLFITVLLSGCTNPPQQDPGPVPVSSGGKECGVPIAATVTGIVDGDTLHVMFDDGTKEKVRLLGIDTPEMKPDGNSPGEYAPLSDSQCLAAWGNAAKKRLSTILKEKRVTLETDCREGERDTYDRYLAYLALADGTDINALMVREGLARAYTRTRAERLPAYLALERTARSAGAGMWGQTGGVCRYPEA